ncbi:MULTISPECIES: FAD-dependent oxidoreductase [Microbacterium]|uniref:FAD-dependent oxidoreductase n=1 Tax=Microbacterium profundi TaxID=450380 RepID=A0ABV3LCS5_9MICO|nr:MULTISPECIES: FAD-dependent oxidoreductase [Microbacterium]MCE7480721.1 FAD-dependent oxidoreductase [Microbacterium profundi]
MSEGAPPLRVVIVGFGPVGARLCEELLPAVKTGSMALTVIGAESDAPYNRVLVAELAVDRADAAGITLHDPQESMRAGVDVRLGTRAVSVDRAIKQIELSNGERVAYDRLVLATGARANIPTLTGIHRPAFDVDSLARSGASVIGADPVLPNGVTVLRDLADAERVRAAVSEGARLVVLGAGVLGLEFALLAAGADAEVAVVHHGATPMPRSLDRGAGIVLSRALREAGVEVYAHSRAESVGFRTGDDGEPAFDALVTADGNYVRGDLLVLSCGVGARAELATAAGIRTAAGIVVDEQLRSWSDDDVFAIGDCAHVVERTVETNALTRLPGAPSGLIGPGWRQAEWLARRLVAESACAALPAAPPAERDCVVMLKADRVDVAAVGDVDVDIWDASPPDDSAPLRHVAQWADPQHGRYLKLVTRGGVLQAFTSVGMPRTAAELTLLYDRRGELPADRSLLLRMDGADDSAIARSDAFAPETTVCLCNGVNVEAIGDSVARGNDTVACLGRDTRAGTGCGGCKPRLVELIERFTSSAQVAPA